MNLMSFLLDEQDLNGTTVERRIDQLISQGGNKSAQTYKLKSTTGKFDQHRDQYSPDLEEFVKNTLGDTLYYLGYAKIGDNPTGFFDFEQHKPENLAKFNQFRSDSKAALEAVTSPDYQNKEYVHGQHETFPIVEGEDLEKLLIPGLELASQKLEEALKASQKLKN